MTCIFIIIYLSRSIADDRSHRKGECGILELGISRARLREGGGQLMMMMQMMGCAGGSGVRNSWTGISRARFGGGAAGPAAGGTGEGAPGEGQRAEQHPQRSGALPLRRMPRTQP